MVVLMFWEVCMGKVIEVEVVVFLVEEIFNLMLCNFGVLISLVCLKMVDDYIFMYLVVVCVLMIVFVC